jgi:hypothetical protein
MLRYTYIACLVILLVQQDGDSADVTRHPCQSVNDSDNDGDEDNDGDTIMCFVDRTTLTSLLPSS